MLGDGNGSDGLMEPMGRFNHTHTLMKKIMPIWHTLKGGRSETPVPPYWVESVTTYLDQFVVRLLVSIFFVFSLIFWMVG